MVLKVLQKFPLQWLVLVHGRLFPGKNAEAKASFSAYVLGKNVLKTGEKVHFSTKEKHDQFWSSFLFLPFSLFWPQNG